MFAVVCLDADCDGDVYGDNDDGDDDDCDYDESVYVDYVICGPKLYVAIRNRCAFGELAMGLLNGPLHGTAIYVDCFAAPRTLGSVYILTHFHADHMTGLRDGWAHGPLYCSVITGKLLTEIQKVNHNVVCTCEVDVPFQVIDPVTHAHLTVTFIDANHCPGSVLVVLEGFETGAVVHTGDFRFYEGLRYNKTLCIVADSCRCDKIYLDTSWAH